jgi:hypothetical protein
MPTKREQEQEIEELRRQWGKVYDIASNCLAIDEDEEEAAEDDDCDDA